jgi:TonB family protein
MMNPNDSNDQGPFLNATGISDSESWLSSIARQLRERREARNAPAPEITAQPDPAALQKFVTAPSLLNSIGALISDTLHPRKLVTTVDPVEVEEIWTKPNFRNPGLISFGVHLAIVGLLLIPVAALTPPAQTATDVVLLSPPPAIVLAPAAGKSGGGGGGGMKTPTPPSKGKPPRGDDKQLVPPMVEVKNLAPELPVEPTIIAPQLAHLQLNLTDLGDPNGVVGPPSAGPGTGGGIGTGKGGGVGEGDGAGLGPGKGGGVGGGVFSVGGGVSAPRVLFKPQPEYSDDARKARAQGTVELLIIVNPDGTVDFQEVRKRLGYGLDQKAIDAVRKWRFEPGKRDGKPVATWVQVEVNFALR